MSKLATIVLAAGQGTRMKSRLPKVLHSVCGTPLIHYPLQLAAGAGSERMVVVVGHGREGVEETVRSATGGDNVLFAVQKEQKGTGHAVLSALPQLKGYEGPVLILSGDVPLLRLDTVKRLKKALAKSESKLAFITFTPADPTGYGRVVREDGQVVAIVEHRDATPSQLKIGEVNSGTYLIDADFLRKSLKKLDTNNSQGEFFLTDLVAMAARSAAVPTIETSAEEVGGINDRVDLARVEETLLRQISDALMREGVTIHQPATVNIHSGVEIGRDTDIGPSVQITGKTKIGENCRIETGAVIHNAVIENDVIIHAYSVIEDAHVGAQAHVGPMARLRPGSRLMEKSRVGNWVELKNTVLGKGSKANHLAYLGDGDIGEGVNLGAGVIFCNYDGFLKHRTVVEDNVFVGSDSQLVAPVTIHRGAYVGSGSTITKDVPEDALAIARSRQTNREGLAKMLRERLAAEKAARVAKKKEQSK